MAIDGNTNTMTQEKAEMQLREEGEVAPSETANNIGNGAEAKMTWKTWLVIFVSILISRSMSSD